jgi:RHS repeat-associated protein
MNKLSSVTGPGGTTSFQYNDQGIRVRTMGANPKSYLVDANNHTGYAQVLEEFSSYSPSPTADYVIGDEVLAEINGGGSDSYLLRDGHGSTRQYLGQDSACGGINNYEAYGDLLGTSTYTAEESVTAYGSSLLYCGEQYDTDLQMYNLRARYYNPSNGRFNQRDTFSGSNDDPQTLHKYLYANCDPISNVDPSGNSTLCDVLCAIGIGLIISAIHLAPIFGLSLLTGKAPDAVGFGAFGTLKIGPVDFFGGVEFDMCPRSGQASATGFGGLAGAINKDSFSKPESVKKFFGWEGGSEWEGGFYEIWYWNVENLNGGGWHPNGWTGLSIGGIWGGMLAPAKPDGSFGWLWGVAWGKSSKQTQGFAVAENDVWNISWDMPKGEMVRTAALGESALTTAELYRNSALPAGTTSKLASIFVNGGLAAAWVNNTYK